jgi:hypothetical protein
MTTLEHRKVFVFLSTNEWMAEGRPLSISKSQYLTVSLNAVSIHPKELQKRVPSSGNACLKYKLAERASFRSYVERCSVCCPEPQNQINDKVSSFNLPPKIVCIYEQCCTIMSHAFLVSLSHNSQVSEQPSS